MPCTGGGCKQRRRNKNPTPPLPYKAKPVLCSAFFSKPQNTQNTWALPGRGSAQQGHAAQSAPPSRSRAGQRPHRGTCRAKIKKYQALCNTKTMIFLDLVAVDMSIRNGPTGVRSPASKWASNEWQAFSFGGWAPLWVSRCSALRVGRARILL